MLREDGVRWVIFDSSYWDWGSAGSWCRWWQSLDDELLRGGFLAAEFPHMSDFAWEFLVETAGERHLTSMQAAGAGPLRIYDLQTQPSLANAAHTDPGVGGSP